MFFIGRLLINVLAIAGALNACGVGQMHGHYSEPRVRPSPPPPPPDARCLRVYLRHLTERIPANATVYVAAPRVSFARGRILVLRPDGRFVLKPDGRTNTIPCGNMAAYAAPGEWKIFTGTYDRSSRKIVLTGKPLSCRRSRNGSSRRIIMAVDNRGLKDSYGVTFKLVARALKRRR